MLIRNGKSFSSQPQSSMFYHRLEQLDTKQSQQGFLKLNIKRGDRIDRTVTKKIKRKCILCSWKVMRFQVSEVNSQ